MENNLVISEMFYSIQGEGQTMGKPAIFLRLAGCNLLCKSESWICDSLKVWKKGTKTEFQNVFSDDYIKKLSNGVHLVITGGEPMLHQKKLKEFLAWFEYYYKFKPIIEVETNGTILPDERFFEKVDFWNCSPKLSTSGEPKTKRFNEVALDRISKAEGSIFKFVISEENDVVELLNEYAPYIDIQKVVLMPAGENQEELSKTRQMVAELCVKLDFKYSDRLHIVIWNKKTGV